ncbi:hypothetical protein F2P81_022230 [Scophthalmus maximus]|uniref:Uncharacterized protein n=1 Tax=Scophthalmus maximus TaxID=52904 RepID=A0A6A4RYH1_SCOMX|nr:hypothetical protein F2P81_022230 [Scophthalmus maximus]
MVSSGAGDATRPVSLCRTRGQKAPRPHDQRTRTRTRLPDVNITSPTVPSPAERGERASSSLIKGAAAPPRSRSPPRRARSQELRRPEEAPDRSGTARRRGASPRESDADARAGARFGVSPSDKLRSSCRQVFVCPRGSPFRPPPPSSGWDFTARPLPPSPSPSSAGTDTAGRAVTADVRARHWSMSEESAGTEACDAGRCPHRPVSGRHGHRGADDEQHLITSRTEDLKYNGGKNVLW